MRKYIYILLLFITTQSFAQTNPLSAALDLYKGGQLNEAKRTIDSAFIANGYYSQNAVAHYIRGFIYKDLYKQNAGSEASYVLRDTSASSFYSVLRLDKDKTYAKEVNQNLKYIATTYYNDAMSSIAAGILNNAEQFYHHYNVIIQQVGEVGFNQKQSNRQFYLALGAAYSKMDGVDSAFVKAVESFKVVLASDSLDKQANYNLGVLYYNEAVNRILGLGFDEDLTSFDDFEDRTIELFKSALPYMKTAYKVDPKDENVLEGLSGIYFSLREFELSSKYKKELTALQN